jgi:cytochrome c biogenesis protein CcmG, thiol:disulfide interchange protein DsbE
MLPAALLALWLVQAAAPDLNKAAPDFSLAGLNSPAPVALSDYKGKVVLIDFWASWCLPCKRLLPQVTGLKTAAPKLQIVAISVDENRGKALAFLSGVDRTGFKAAQDADHKTAEAYSLEGMPTCFLIDKRGRIRFRHDGYTAEDLETLQGEVKLLLSEP